MTSESSTPGGGLVTQGANGVKRSKVSRDIDRLIIDEAFLSLRRTFGSSPEAWLPNIYPMATRY